MKWLAENQIKLKSEILTLDITIGLRSDTLSKTKQYFYFLVARCYIWSCRIQEVLPKIKRFPSSRQTSWLFTKRDRGSELGTTEKQIRLWLVHGGLKPGTSGLQHQRTKPLGHVVS